MTNLEPWVISILADPVSKQPCQPDAFNSSQGVIDARVFGKRIGCNSGLFRQSNETIQQNRKRGYGNDF